jgi:lipid-A-disaccharide synthase-like uncharacterized protein
MAVISCIVSGAFLFFATYKTKARWQLLSSFVVICWFTFAFYFNFSSLSFISGPNNVACFVHMGILLGLIVLSHFSKKRKLVNCLYSISAIFLWSFLVDTVDYLILFPEWSAGISFFTYVMNGFLFNLPKCLVSASMGIVLALAVRWNGFQSRESQLRVASMPLR